MPIWGPDPTPIDTDGGEHRVVTGPIERLGERSHHAIEQQCHVYSVHRREQWDLYTVEERADDERCSQADRPDAEEDGRPECEPQENDRGEAEKYRGQRQSLAQ